MPEGHHAEENLGALLAYIDRAGLELRDLSQIGCDPELNPARQVEGWDVGDLCCFNFLWSKFD